MPSVISDTGVQIDITSDGREVIAAGSVHTFEGNELRFDLDDIAVLIEFREDPEEKKERLEVNEARTTNNELALVLGNFNNPLGTGTTNPLSLGKLKGRELSFAFSVYSISEESIKLFHYTFFLGERIDG